MVKGLEHELQARLDGKRISSMRGNHPSPATVDAKWVPEKGSRQPDVVPPSSTDSIDGVIHNQPWVQEKSTLI